MATSVAGYERGERNISLERFVLLCRLYEVPPERLLAEILHSVPSLGDVLDIARQNRADEQAMAEKITASWDHVLDLTLADAQLAAR